MNHSTNQSRSAEQPDRVYGFMDQTTNVFYAFESFEEYDAFLQWLEQQNEDPLCPLSHRPIRDEDLLED
jgi:hypothetical protein